MAKYGSETIPTCLNCDRNNQTKVCKKCGVVYCKHYSSIVDIEFCGNCISDIILKETIIEKEIEHIRSDGSVSFSRKYQARRLQLMNVDWLFANKAIEDSTDAEIDASIEYHAAIKDLMLMERASRQQERSRKMASIKIVHVNRESQHEIETKQKRSKGKGKLKERELTQDDILAALKLVMGNLTPEQITEMIAKGAKK